MASSNETVRPRSERRAAAGRRTSRKRARRILWWVLGGLAVVLVAVVAWVGIRALLARDALQEAIPMASEVADAIIAEDQETASRATAGFVDRVDRAASLTSDPIWRGMEILPGIGPNLSAFREAAAIARDVAHDAVEPLSSIGTGIDIGSLRPTGGAVDLSMIVQLREPISSAATALEIGRDRGDAIDTDAVLGPVRSGVDQLRTALTDASEQVTAVDRITTLVPAMLGDAGPKSHLLLIQNPAELRAGGGITGALALIGTDQGRISLQQQASSSDFGRFDPPVLELADETIELYQDIPARYIQNVTQTPSFRLAGELASRMWTQSFGGQVDSVISVDPVALGYLLKATGPVSLPTGDELNTENAVQLLLSEVYSRYTVPAQQDAFFAAAAAAVFEKVSAGDLEPRALIDALVRASEEGRVQLWSADEALQTVIEETTLAGAAPASDDSVKRFGVYLNDATGAKMDYYLDTQLAIGQGQCGSGAESYVVQITMTNTAPADAGTTLPDYVTGAGVFGVSPGNIRTQVSVYGAGGTSAVGVAMDEEQTGYSPMTDGGAPVMQKFVELAPGETTTLEFAFAGGETFRGALELMHTPTVHEIETKTLTPTCESAVW